MKVDLHIHTKNSKDAIHDIKVIIKRAKKVGLSAIAITDHNKLFSEKRAKELSRQYEILIIPGIEIGKLRFQNHILALNINKLPDFKNTEEILELIEEENGLSIAPHPFSRIGFNNYKQYKFHAVEAKNGINWLSNIRYKSQSKIPELANSDAHAAYMLGYTWTETEDAETIEQVLENIRKGKCKPCGRFVPNFLTLRLGLTLGFKCLVKKINIIKKEGFGIEDTFYSNYRGTWAVARTKAIVKEIEKFGIDYTILPEKRRADILKTNNIDSGK